MLDRRTFLGLAAGGLPAVAMAPAFAKASAGALVQGANERIVVGVMGCSRSNSGKSPGRGSAPANAEIEEGFKSTLLCHLGNISYRSGRTLRFDPKARAIEGDRDAMAYWSREYRPGWEPKV